MEYAASWRDGWGVDLAFDQIGRSLRGWLLRQPETAA